MATFDFEIRVNPDRNLIYMTQKGRGNRTDLEKLRDAYLDAVKRLKPGFVMVHDQRQLEPYEDDALEAAQELVKLTNDYEARAVIRVTAESLKSSVRVSRVLTGGRARYRNIRVSSLEEAEKALAELGC